jgi:hypothetical protein
VASPSLLSGCPHPQWQGSCLMAVQAAAQAQEDAGVRDMHMHVPNRTTPRNSA